MNTILFTTVMLPILLSSDGGSAAPADPMTGTDWLIATSIFGLIIGLGTLAFLWWDSRD